MQFAVKCFAIYLLTTTASTVRVTVQQADLAETEFEELTKKNALDETSKTSGSHLFAFSCTKKDTSRRHLHGPEPTTSPARGLVTLNVGGTIDIKATSGSDPENLPQVQFGWPTSAQEVVDRENALGSSTHAYKDFKRSSYGLVNGAVGQFCRQLVDEDSYAADVAMCEGYGHTPGCPSGYSPSGMSPSGLGGFLEVENELSLAKEDEVSKLSKTSGSHTFAFSCDMKDTSRPHLHGPEPTTTPARGLVTLNVTKLPVGLTQRTSQRSGLCGVASGQATRR